MTLEGAWRALGGLLVAVKDWLFVPQFLAGLVVGAGLLYLLSRRLRHGSAVTFALPFNLGSTTITATYADRVAAWKLYVQLVTRKAAIPFDEEHDTIVEVYDSLRKLFESTRTLLLDLPPSEYGKSNGLASLMLRVMNDGVRPHLTFWQADFRRWWSASCESSESAGCSPQEIQRRFPRYRALVADLHRTNTELSKFADELLGVARGRRRTKPARRRPKAVPPTPESPPIEIGTDLAPPPIAPEVGGSEKPQRFDH